MKRVAHLFQFLLLFSAIVHAQDSVSTPTSGESSSSNPISIEAPPIDPVRLPQERDQSFHWVNAFRQSFYFLGIQHSARMAQPKTRREFTGPFFGDYVDSVTNIHEWGDGDSIITNYVGHPMQGAITGFIQIQNDPHGMKLQVSSVPAYWKSRLKAMAWAAAYSTQFEIGPLSEATLGNVGKKKGTAGYVDLIMTPVAGFGLIVVEDAVDRWLIRRLEHADNQGMIRFYRIAFNPTRSVANLLRFKHPWYRDSRGMRPEDVEANKKSSSTTKVNRGK